MHRLDTCLQSFSNVAFCLTSPSSTAYSLQVRPGETEAGFPRPGFPCCRPTNSVAALKCSSDVEHYHKLTVSRLDIMLDFTASSSNKLCGRPPQYAPVPCKLTFDL